MELPDRSSPRSLRLTPLGYEFPDADDSWLVIEGVVNGLDKQWSFRDPALTSRELAELVAWMRAAAEGRAETNSKDMADEPALDFLEPCLGFSVVEQSEVDLTIRAYLRYEAAPPDTFHEAVSSDGQPYIDKTDSNYFVDLTLSREDVVTAANQLEVEGRPYPLRGSEF